MADIAVNTIRGFRSSRLLRPGVVRTELYLRPTDQAEDVRHLQLSPDGTNFQVFSRWRDGATGSATYESATVPIQVGAEPSSLGHAFIQLDLTLAQIKIFNDADEVKFSFAGDRYTCTIVEPEYLVQDGTRSFVNRSFNAFTLNRVLTATVDELASSRVRVAVNNDFSQDVVSLYLVGIAGLRSTVNTEFPVIIDSVNKSFDLTGSYDSRVNLQLVFGVGGGGGGSQLTLPVVLTRMAGTGPPPVIPDLSDTRVEIVSLQSEHEGEVTVEYRVTPTLTSTSGGEIRVEVSETMPQLRFVGRSSTTNLLRTSITRAGIERGKWYSVIVRYRKSATEVYNSEPSYFQYLNTLVVKSDVEHLAQTVRSSKIFLTGLANTSFSYDIVNDIFLNDFVSQIKMTYREGSNTRELVVDNNFDNAVLTFSVSSLRSNSIYTVTFTAITSFGEVEIAQTTVKTTIEAIDGAPLEARTQYAEEIVLAMSYDSDILEIVSALPDACRERLVEANLAMLNDPVNDGHIHDFNKFNKRGSVFGKTVGDLAKTKTTDNIEFALGNVAALVNDIDAGAPA